MKKLATFTAAAAVTGVLALAAASPSQAQPYHAYNDHYATAYSSYDSAYMPQSNYNERGLTDAAPRSCFASPAWHNYKSCY